MPENKLNSNKKKLLMDDGWEHKPESEFEYETFKHPDVHGMIVKRSGSRYYHIVPGISNNDWRSTAGPFSNVDDAKKHALNYNPDLDESTATGDIMGYNTPMSYPLKKKTYVDWTEERDNEDDDIKEDVSIAAELKRMRNLMKHGMD